MHYWETGIFGAKNAVNRFYKTTSSSHFSQSSISHNESHERKQTILPHRHLFLPFRLIDAGNGGWRTRSRMPRGHNPHNIVCRDWRWCNRLHRLRQDLPDTGWHRQDWDDALPRQDRPMPISISPKQTPGRIPTHGVRQRDWEWDENRNDATSRVQTTGWWHRKPLRATPSAPMP